jgi:hypothetical protein
MFKGEHWDQDVQRKVDAKKQNEILSGCKITQLHNCNTLFPLLPMSDNVFTPPDNTFAAANALPPPAPRLLGQVTARLRLRLQPAHRARLCVVDQTIHHFSWQAPSA